MKRGDQEWMDSMNHICDSLAEMMHQDFLKDMNKVDDANALRSSTVEPLDTDANWYMNAQSYVVPAFFVIMLTLFIFGAMTLFDTRKASKNKHKLKVLDFLDDEDQSK